jgi:hypothetical protein
VEPGHRAGAARPWRAHLLSRRVTALLPRYTYTTPLQTAGAFIGLVMTIDFFVVGLVVNRNLEMFTSVLGTWVPFALIFTSTWLTGRRTAPVSAAEDAAPPVQRAAA